MIPFINRTVDIILSDRLEFWDVNVREVIDEFQSQCDDFHAMFEAFVLMAPGRYRVTCKSSRKLQAAEAMAFTVRGLPVEFQPISSFKWVNITRLSYGVPEQEVSNVLSVYGPIKMIKLEQYSNVYTGVRNVLMEVRSNIPARVRIAGHMCNVYYKGQKRLCFHCGKEGHIISKCPAKDPALERTGEPVVGQSAPVAVAPVPLVPVAAALVPDAPAPAVPVASATVADVGVSPSDAGRDVNLVAAVVGDIVLSVVGTVGENSVDELSVSPRVSSLVMEDAVLLPGLAPSAVVLSTVDVVSSRPSPLQSSPTLAGSKRGRSGRSKSRSPLRKGGRRSLSLSSDSNPGDISEDLSFVSPTSSQLHVSDGDADLPEDNFFATYPGHDLIDDPLTQFPPNLPCATPERIHFYSEPEASQVSEESFVVQQFFAKSKISSGEEESS
jgi:hypothetical protein